ncbi:MAG: 2OG-Fe(II) oxygenase [Elusimicrobia bacterium]|nr:2OG-Fe(II) oxygenase [Elusimicrobiota bacterium]MDE2313643.1 2OG-Fe(II) oxygenase [Elusimicrobiota bacterium]
MSPSSSATAPAYSDAARKASYGLLAKMGLFLAPNFLSPQECVRLRGEINSAPTRPTEAYSPTQVGPAPNSKFSSSLDHDIPPASLASLQNRFLALIPRLEKHFNEKLALREPVGVRTYGPGGFLAAHTDCINERFLVNSLPGKKVPVSRLRKVSAVIYLSTEAHKPGPGRHCGGPLVFYGLIPGRKTRSLGLPLRAEAGLLIAFRADVGHEVRPVLAGTRYTVTAFISSRGPKRLGPPQP